VPRPLLVAFNGLAERFVHFRCTQRALAYPHFLQLPLPSSCQRTESRCLARYPVQLRNFSCRCTFRGIPRSSTASGHGTLRGTPSTLLGGVAQLRNASARCVVVFHGIVFSRLCGGMGT
jgi:hypothetical protein